MAHLEQQVLPGGCTQLVLSVMRNIDDNLHILLIAQTIVGGGRCKADWCIQAADNDQCPHWPLQGGQMGLRGSSACCLVTFVQKGSRNWNPSQIHCFYSFSSIAACSILVQLANVFILSKKMVSDFISLSITWPISSQVQFFLSTKAWFVFLFYMKSWSSKSRATSETWDMGEYHTRPLNFLKCTNVVFTFFCSVGYAILQDQNQDDHQQ